MLFGNFTNLIFKLQKLNKVNKKVIIIKHFLENELDKEYIYDFLVTLFPFLETERKIHFKEKKFTNFLINELKLGNKKQIMLKNYNDKKYNSKFYGDYPKIASLICKNLLGKGNLIMFLDIRNFIKDYFIWGNKNCNLNLYNLNHNELEILIRIIIKEIKINLSWEKVFNLIHKNLYNLYKYCKDIKKCLNELENCNNPLEMIQPMNPLQPCLASKLGYEQLKIYCNNNPILCEIKYDGERLLIHKSNDKIELFSRNCINVTNIYKDIINNLNKSINISSCILDSEIIVLEKFSSKKVNFGKNKAVASNKNNFKDKYNLAGNFYLIINSNNIWYNIFWKWIWKNKYGF